ncbi:MAG: FAD-dependent oxidoreductase [Chloroflexi bacterium]|nr:FAD-dependent oxidoreductase [Chloroflexota bacterium]
MSNPFPRLFSPFKLGNVALRNRYVMVPMTTRYTDDNGGVTDKLVAFYARRAEGGVGLIVFEASYVERRGKHSAINTAGIHEDALIPGYRRLTEAVHAHGTPIFMQLGHAGSRANSSVTGIKPIGPSHIDLRHEEVPQELSTEGVRELIEAFAQAARRAEEAGFDGVELHGAHGYCLAEFLSPAYNKRKDIYGGDSMGRTRIVREIIERIHALAGKDFPVIVRLHAQESYKGGLKLEDSIENARNIQRAGPAAIHLSAPRGPRGLPEAGMERGRWATLAEAFKKALNVPVITVGAITHPSMAENILKHGQADLVAIGRPLLCDPDLPRKAASGSLEDFRECILCNMCHHTRPQVNCIINFECGREYVAEYHITRAIKPKKVMVVGGGPGGLEAARVATLRGHNVTLYEQSQELGGSLRLATSAPHMQHMKEGVDYLVREVKRLKVPVVTGTRVTTRLVKNEKPDVVIVATGSKLGRLRVPSQGAGPRVVSPEDVIAKRVQVGDCVVVVGSSTAAATVAEVLALQGKGVSFVVGAEGLGKDMHLYFKEALIDRLRDEAVIMYEPAELARIVGRDVVVRKLVPVKGLKFAVQEQTIKDVDTIVLGEGAKPNAALAARIKGLAPEVYVIGDAAKVADAMDAIHHGSRVARSLGVEGRIFPQLWWERIKNLP